MNRRLRRILLGAAMALSMTQRVVAAVVSIDDGTFVPSYLNHLPPDHEIHVISVYQTASGTGDPQVDIKYNLAEPMKPIVVVLSSYEGNTWHLNIDPAANIEQIILNGYYAQTVTGAGAIPV